MYAVERLSSYISRGVYVVSGPFHPFGGAVDIIVVQQPDGSFKSSPWYVKFGKFQGVLKTKEKVVDIAVNGVKAEFHMFLDHKGEAYFLTELEGEEVDTVFSPRSSSDETEEHSQSGGIEKSRSGDFDANRPSSPASTDGANTNILVKTTSRRSGILRRVFGRKSMKEDGSKTEGSSVGAEQMSSPESTEVAADLSEMKWSTDIPAIECEMVNASTFARPASEIDKGLQATDEDSMASPVHHEIVDTSSDLPTVNLETDPRYSGSFPNNPESPDEPTGSVEQLMNVSTFEVFDKCEIVSEVTDTFSLKSSVLTERIEGSVSESNTDSPQNPEFVEFKAGQNTHSGTEISSGKMCNSLSNGISEEKTECENLISLTHTETTEISTVGMNGSFERVTETLEFCYGRCEEVESHGRLLYQNSELMTEVNLQPDSTVPTVEENLCATGNVGDRDFSEFVNTKTVHENEIASLNRVAESLLPPTLHVSTFNSVETKTSQVDHQDTVTEGLPQDDNLEALPVEVLEDESPMVKLSSSHIPENDGLDLGKLSKAPLSLNQEAGVNETFDLIEETVSQSRHGPSDLGSLGPVLWKEYNGLHDDSEDCSPSPELSHIIQEAVVDSVFVNESIPPSESSEEDQLLFGDMDGLDPIGVQFKEQVSQESMQTENYPALTLDGIEDDHERINTNHASSLGKLDDEYPESSLQGLIKEFRPCSSPISILKTPVASGENDVWLPESLPIIRHIESLKGSNASHPLSRSLDSTSENLKLGLLKQAASTLSEPGADPEHNLSLEHPRFLGAQASEELGLQSTSDPVGEPEKVIVQSSGSWLWPFPMRKSRTVNSIQPAKNDTKDSDASDCTSGTIKDKHVTRTSSTKKKVRSIIPTSEQLAALNLEEGRNIITFTFSTAVLGRQQVDARIYLWKWNTRIVVSDVDGTITKSDVLGQFMPLVGKDWSQTGVTHLFSSIKENGYQFLFLSARSISQAHLTRQFLFNLKQDGKALPDGPVVISPDGLFPSLYREVIRRAPHEFKIACLEDIKALFPPDCHPFYAGFGNRDTDEFSYLKVGIPKGKIFIINPKGQVAINRGVDTKSYTSLHVLVNGMFPAMSSAEQEDFNSWNYWKVPLPEINF